MFLPALQLFLSTVTEHACTIVISSLIALMDDLAIQLFMLLTKLFSLILLLLKVAKLLHAIFQLFSGESSKACHDEAKRGKYKFGNADLVILV